MKIKVRIFKLGEKMWDTFSFTYSSIVIATPDRVGIVQEIWEFDKERGNSGCPNVNDDLSFWKIL